MDGPGDQLLPRARLAGDQHRRGRAGDALHDAEDLLHLRALADDVGEGVALLEGGAEVEVLVLELLPLDGLADDGQTDACSGKRLFGVQPLENSKYPIAVFFGNANSVVLQKNANEIAGLLSPYLDPRRDAARRKGERVG